MAAEWANRHGEAAAERAGRLSGAKGARGARSCRSQQGTAGSAQRIHLEIARDRRCHCRGTAGNNELCALFLDPLLRLKECFVIFDCGVLIQRDSNTLNFTRAPLYGSLYRDGWFLRQVQLNILVDRHARLIKYDSGRNGLVSRFDRVCPRKRNVSL